MIAGFMLPGQLVYALGPGGKPDRREFLAAGFPMWVQDIALFPDARFQHL